MGAHSSAGERLDTVRHDALHHMGLQNAAHSAGAVPGHPGADASEHAQWLYQQALAQHTLQQHQQQEAARIQMALQQWHQQQQHTASRQAGYMPANALQNAMWLLQQQRQQQESHVAQTSHVDSMQMQQLVQQFGVEPAVAVQLLQLAPEALVTALQAYRQQQYHQQQQQQLQQSSAQSFEHTQHQQTYAQPSQSHGQLQGHSGASAGIGEPAVAGASVPGYVSDAGASMWGAVQAT